MFHIAIYDEIDQFKDINNKIINYKLNGISNILCNNKYKIYGKSVIVKYKINSDLILTMESLNFRELLDVFINKKIHKGVIINTNKELKDVDYVGFPLSWLYPELQNNYKYYELDIFDKIFMFYIEIKPEINEINELASLLYGSLVKGRVFIAIREKPTDVRMMQYMYYNITSEYINKLLCLFEDKNLEYNIEPYYHDNKNNKYEGFYNFINKLYYSQDKKLIEKKIINYETESLNEKTYNELNNNELNNNK
jgi:hypothetical protein